eukprot:1318517-Prymnesium_polylepis.2
MKRSRWSGASLLAAQSHVWDSFGPKKSFFQGEAAEPSRSAALALSPHATHQLCDITLRLGNPFWPVCAPHSTHSTQHAQNCLPSSWHCCL